MDGYNAITHLTIGIVTGPSLFVVTRLTVQTIEHRQR